MIEIPSWHTLREMLQATPALSLGLNLFSYLFYVIYPGGSTALVLYPNAPLKLNLNAISLYIFPHASITHLCFNLLALTPLLLRFEKANGTIYTGITLNLLAVSTALFYCVVGYFLFPKAGAAGLLGICFSFLTYFCQKEHVQTPVLYTFNVVQWEIPIYTEYFPFMNLFFVAFVVPLASFFGHLAGIGSGYLLASGYLKVLYPPLRAIMFVEEKLAPGIDQLKKIVDYVPEEDAVAERGVSYVPFFLADLELAIPVLTSPAPATVVEPFERRVDS